MTNPRFHAPTAVTLLTILGIAASSIAARADVSHPDPALVSAAASPARSPAALARDPARHPIEELTFFGLAPTMTVVELWPGGGYWTDILGPYLAPGGHYYIALPAPGNAEEDAGVKRFRSDRRGERPARDPARNGARRRPLRRRPTRFNRPCGHVSQSP